MSKFGDIFCSIRWGEYSLLALYISVLSGLVVGYQYDPAAPFYSVSTLDMLVPFGEYFRSLHFYSSQFFFLFCVLHVIGTFDAAQNFTRKQWILLTATLPVTILLLFTGYVLRGDSTGYSAGMIAEAILLDLPLIGQPINDLLFSISDNGMKRIYVNHIIGLSILGGWLAWSHVKKYRVPFSRHIILTLGIIIFSIFVAAPFEPDHLGVTYISGPWFFLGLQELLRYFPPMIAGFIIPLTLLVAIALLNKTDRYYRAVLLFIICWLLGYAFLTGIAYMR